MLGIDVQERVAFISELCARCPYLVLRSLSLIVRTRFKHRLASIERVKFFLLSDPRVITRLRKIEKSRDIVRNAYNRQKYIKCAKQASVALIVSIKIRKKTRSALLRIKTFFLFFYVLVISDNRYFET